MIIVKVKFIYFNYQTNKTTLFDKIFNIDECDTMALFGYNARINSDKLNIHRCNNKENINYMFTKFCLPMINRTKCSYSSFGNNPDNKLVMVLLQDKTGKIIYKISGEHF